MKVTQGEVLDNIKEVKYHRVDGTTLTLCAIVLKNNFVCHGTSACVDPAEFDADLGRSIAYKRAEDQVWLVLGFRTADKIAAQREG